MNLKEHREWFRTHKLSSKQEKDKKRITKLWDKFVIENGIICEFEYYNKEYDEVCIKREFDEYNKYALDADIVLCLDKTDTDEVINNFFHKVIKDSDSNIVNLYFTYRRNIQKDCIDLIIKFDFLKKNNNNQ